MQDLNDKINNGGATAQGQLSADEWNELPSEVQNVIESVGQTLSGGDLTQLVKAIVSYSANGNFFADSGIANAYVLTAIGAKQGLYAYGDGSEIVFYAAASNDNASTVNVSTLGVKSIVNELGAPLVEGDIVLGFETRARYDLANDRFVLNNKVNRTGDTMTGNLQFPNLLGIVGEEAGGTSRELVKIDATDVAVIGNNALNMSLNNAGEIEMPNHYGVTVDLQQFTPSIMARVANNGVLKDEFGVVSTALFSTGVYLVVFDRVVDFANIIGGVTMSNSIAGGGVANGITIQWTSTTTATVTIEEIGAGVVSQSWSLFFWELS